MKRWLHMWREAVPVVVRLLVSGDVDRFETESRAFRAKYGIGS